MRAVSLAMVALHMSLDQADSIASFIVLGSSLFSAEDEPVLERTGVLKTRPGELGGLEGGEVANAYDVAIWLTSSGRKSKGFSDSLATNGRGSFSDIGILTGAII